MGAVIGTILITRSDQHARSHQPFYDEDDVPVKMRRFLSSGWGILAAQIIGGSDVEQAVELWEGDALCAEIDPELFFPDPGEYIKSRIARTICTRCTMQEACLQWADRTHEEYGIWGGMTSTQRLRKR